jgi:hypothetical protein
VVALARAWRRFPRCGSLLPRARSSVATAPPALRDLAAFGGCWRTEGGASYTEEIWSAPTANLMLGLTLFVRDGRAVPYELTRVELEADGRIVMTPYPDGKPSPHGFVLTTWRDGEAIFEAPEHDYPKRILYRANADSRPVRSVVRSPCSPPTPSSPFSIASRRSRDHDRCHDRRQVIETPAHKEALLALKRRALGAVTSSVPLQQIPESDAVRTLAAGVTGALHGGSGYRTHHQDPHAGKFPQ